MITKLVVFIDKNLRALWSDQRNGNEDWRRSKPGKSDKEKLGSSR